MRSLIIGLFLLYSGTALADHIRGHMELQIGRTSLSSYQVTPVCDDSAQIEALAEKSRNFGHQAGMELYKSLALTLNEQGYPTCGSMVTTIKPLEITGAGVLPGPDNVAVRKYLILKFESTSGEIYHLLLPASVRVFDETETEAYMQSREKNVEPGT